MKKRTIWTILILLIIFWVIRSQTKEKSLPDTDSSTNIVTKNSKTVSADDGSAKVIIPDGALPEWVDIASISIDPGVEWDIKLTTEWDTITSRTFDLLPDGTVFDKPVILEIATDPADGEGIQFFHYNADGIELMVPKESRWDTASEKVIFSFEIDHFSRAVYFHYRMFNMVMDTLGNQAVDVEFDASVVIGKINDEVVSDNADYLREIGSSEHNRKVTRYIMQDEPRTIELGEFKAEWPIGPSEVENPDADTEITADSYRATESFTCTDQGEVTISYKANIKWPVTMYFEETPYRSDMSIIQFAWWKYLSWVTAEIPNDWELSDNIWRTVSQTFTCVIPEEEDEMIGVLPWGIIIEEWWAVEFIGFAADLKIEVGGLEGLRTK